MASLTDRFSYLQPLKAKLPPTKKKAVIPTVKTYSAVSATPTKLQQSSSATNCFCFSPDNSLQVASTSKACSSTPMKPRLASLPVESCYYHEVDSDFLDFDSWSPVNMLAPLSPPDHDIQGTYSRATNPPQPGPTSYRREASSTYTVQTAAKSIPPMRTNQNNNKQFTNMTKQTNTMAKTSSVSKNDPCSFFTAGSTK